MSDPRHPKDDRILSGSIRIDTSPDVEEADKKIREKLLGVAAEPAKPAKEDDELVLNLKLAAAQGGKEKTRSALPQGWVDEWQQQKNQTIEDGKALLTRLSGRLDPAKLDGILKETADLVTKCKGFHLTQLETTLKTAAQPYRLVDTLQNPEKMKAIAKDKPGEIRTMIFEARELSKSSDFDDKTQKALASAADQAARDYNAQLRRGSFSAAKTGKVTKDLNEQVSDELKDQGPSFKKK